MFISSRRQLPPAQLPPAPPLLVLLVLTGSVLAAKDPNHTLIHEWPMLMAHDAATTYLPSGLLHPINTWAKTQPDGGLPGLLDCGARAFDWRPTLLANGTLAMHHAFKVIDMSLDVALNDMLAWAASHNASAENLAVLGVTDCTCQDKQANPCTCHEEINTFLKSKNIPYLKAPDLQKGMTVDEVVKLGARSGGGASVVAVGDWVANYEPRVTCSGYLSGANRNKNINVDQLLFPSLYTCYVNSSTKAFPVNRMFQYIDNVTRRGPPSNRSLSTVQALWEEDAASVAIGTLHLSSLLEDESRSQLNNILAQRIKSGQWNVSQVGIIEINNICDGGLELLKAFREAS